MSTEARNTASEAEANLKGYADELVQHIQTLRREQGIADGQPIEAYVTNTEIVRSLMKQYRSYIEEKTNIVDLVQVNDDAGNPMPEQLPQTEYNVGDQAVTIAISESKNGNVKRVQA
ncbi:MAG: DUF5915 domain-containing protein [Chloroflexi bacterium]|nr:DUF5915 domain-containing protein [Chloroflexota bacterium]